MADPIRQLMQDAMDGDPGEEGEMQVPEYRARVFAKYEADDMDVITRGYEDGTRCLNCGALYADTPNGCE